MTEVWRKTPGWPYSASNMGRVRRDLSVPGTTAGKILKRTIRKNGYAYVELWKNNARKTCKVSRLVATAFHGPCPEGMECGHLNGHRSDDRPENLAWITRQENANHRVLHGNSGPGEGNPNSKMTNEEVLQIRQMARDGIQYKEISEHFRITKDHISQIVLRKIWRHI